MHRDDKTRIGVRSLSLIALLLMAALLAACGGQSKPKPPPGSPQNPLVAQAPQDTVTPGRLNEAAPAAKGARRGPRARSPRPTPSRATRSSSSARAASRAAGSPRATS